MKIFSFTRLALIAPVAVMTSLSMTAKADTLADECVELGGDFYSPYCTVITSTEIPFSTMVRPSGNSGRGWTVSGVDVEYQKDIYVIDQKTEEQEILIKGDPTLPGCGASGETPKKCRDHYETKEVTVDYWRLKETNSWTEQTITGCFNPGGRNMGTHQHCAI
jgi:hypothetical protein